MRSVLAWRGRVLFNSSAKLRFSQRSVLRSVSGMSNDTPPDEENFSSGTRNSSTFIQIGSAGLLVSGIVLVWYQRWKNRRSSDQPAFSLQLSAGSGASAKDKSTEEKSKISIRERRYKEFASIYYKGEPYMTPRDFLESVTVNKPRMHEPHYVGEAELEGYLKKTVSRSKGSIHLFRDMWNEGILTYADYLFLLTALVKTRRQFEVAFKMIDADRSDSVDLKEFNKVLQAVTTQRDNALIQQSLERSTLSVHLFGQKGREKLYSKDFYQFIENLQEEILEIEFNKYAGGSPTISEEDFARILLRHTTWDLDPVFERLKKGKDIDKGVTFDQFCDFCELLNSLEDFEIAMMMFTIAGCSVTEEEFGRAAKVCLGKPLDASVVSIVFNIFDVDGDRKLSYREFLSVMKSWKLRGLRMREEQLIGGWSTFKTCIKMELRNR